MPLGHIAASLLALGSAVSAGDSAAVPACRAVAAGVAPAPVAGDLTAALTLHGGVVRWATDGRPLVVWLQARPQGVAPTLFTEAEWRATLVEGVVAWSGAAPGLRTTIGHDSAAADVRVVWAPTLPASAPGDQTAGVLASLTAGRTIVTPDASGRAVAATVVLATATGTGAAYQPRDVRAVVQHEMGHALGLAHHRSPASVMAPLVRAERIGVDDRAVLRALYSLAVGTPCARGG